jgi:hypothetical protein
MNGVVSVLWMGDFSVCIARDTPIDERVTDIFPILIPNRLVGRRLGTALLGLLIITHILYWEDHYDEYCEEHTRK